MRLVLTVLAVAANLVLLHYAHSLEQPPMSPSQDARARQMTEAVEAAAKIPQPKQDCVWISERVCVTRETLRALQR